MKIIFRFFLLFFVLSTSQVFADLSVTEKEELEASVKTRWGAIIGHKFGESYAFATPTYKAAFTKDLYVNQFSHSIDWNLTKIGDIKYDRVNNVAVVKVVVETTPRNSKGLNAETNKASVEIREKWLHIKGRWWHSSNE